MIFETIDKISYIRLDSYSKLTNVEIKQSLLEISGDFKEENKYYNFNVEIEPHMKHWLQ